jgi:UDP-galactopyranose mutase
VTCLVVFSHLRWDFVFQRPQQLMTRFARARPVFFIEEPVYDAGEPFIEYLQPAENLHVLRPHTPVKAPGFNDQQTAALSRLLADCVVPQLGTEYCAWLYTPMAIPLLKDLTPLAVIYDCMDDLTSFADAPPDLIRNERRLMEIADVVFTGGPGLYEAKRGHSDAVHCFPSSVDSAHFAQGSQSANEHRSLSLLGRPRLGFYGVIDERFDAKLVAAVASERPDWQICLVGPIVKIDAATLPRAYNIHYYGQQAYGELPKFLAGWDVCLLPFALNDATRYISPTKTLEYMAAERPIVSTPINDVVRLFGDLVLIADTSEAFIDACERALCESAAQRIERCREMRRCVTRSSWDVTAAAMAGLIDEAIAKESRLTRTRPAPRRTRAPLHPF